MQGNQHFYTSLAWLQTTFDAAARRNDYAEEYQKMINACEDISGSIDCSIP
jgi:hypothetical protein